MSLLIAGVMSLGQLCYNASEDTGSHHFMKHASLFEEPLLILIDNKKSDCIKIENKAEEEEARKMVRADSTRKTLTLN